MESRKLVNRTRTRGPLVLQHPWRESCTSDAACDMGHIHVDTKTRQA